MCLALPGKVIEQNGFFALVQIGKAKRKLLNSVEARTGEWVLVENGMITERLEKKEQEIMNQAWSRATKKKKKGIRNQ